MSEQQNIINWFVENDYKKVRVIDIDSQFDYFLLDGLSRNQANQLQSFIKNLPEGDYSITEITDSGLYYVIYETSDNIKVEVVRFKVSTRDEDFLVRLNFIYP